MEIDLTTSYVGILSLIVFVLAYAVVMAEEFSHLRKSKPVIISAAVIWGIIAFHFSSDKQYAKEIEYALEHNILEFAELFLFLLVAMTYINALEERKVFDVVRYQLTSRGFSFRQLFIFTGIITFFLSPIADNLTTALVMCSVVMACGKGNTKFISIGCINIVVAANAGGAFSPFGDITTLMVWQAGIVEFFTFFKIFFPSVVNYIIPAAVMYFFIPNEKPQISSDKEYMKRGGRVIIFLGLLTIFSAVNFHNILHLPPMLGMMFGLGLLGLYSFYLQITHDPSVEDEKFDLAFTNIFDHSLYPEKFASEIYRVLKKKGIFNRKYYHLLNQIILKTLTRRLYLKRYLLLFRSIINQLLKKFSVLNRRRGLILMTHHLKK